MVVVTQTLPGVARIETTVIHFLDGTFPGRDCIDTTDYWKIENSGGGREAKDDNRSSPYPFTEAHYSSNGAAFRLSVKDIVAGYRWIIRLRWQIV